MKTRIYCKNPRKGVHSFYVEVDGKEYFLFNQRFHLGVENAFRNGVRLDGIFNYEKASRNATVLRTCLKIPSYIRYIENEFGIIVLDQTQRKEKQIQAFKKRVA